MSKTETKAPTLREALVDIALGEGPFSRDSLTHAGNCIENMKAIARAAITRDEEVRVVNREMVAVLSTVQQVLIARGFGVLDQNPQGIHDLVGSVLGRASELEESTDADR